MIERVGVKFNKDSTVYFFDANGIGLKKGDVCVVESERCLDIGTVVQNITNIENETTPYSKVIRMATEEDRETVEKNDKKESIAYHTCVKKITDKDLNMKLVAVRYTFDSTKIIFYFTAEGRIDFRELVKELAHHFKARIELHQIGVRDEAKVFGGFSWCGRELCCGTFLKEFNSVTIKMAKEQNLILTPSKISGACGRLMCCLGYEHKNYAAVKRCVPREGSRIKIGEQQGTIMEVNVVKEQVKIKFSDDRIVWMPIKEFTKGACKCQN
ncbi:MAG: stage 0 sporulation family protein [Candidatus Desantisbacteria bacterium]